MSRVLVVLGTRPEGIKLAPLVRELRARPDRFDTRLCVTGQHRTMLDPILQFFGLVPDHDLALMKPGQTLFDVTAGALKGLEPVLDEVRPDWVVVQGDTTTALAGALAGFYKRVRVAHVEAGLRTGDLHSPFPEEANRVIVSRLAALHLAPTPGAAANLAAEGVRRGVHVVGNTVIDALLEARARVEAKGADYAVQFPMLSGRRLVLVTGHRRESFGEPFENICRALRTLSARYTDTDWLYPVHLNPNVREPVNRLLSGLPNVHLVEPVAYPQLVWLLGRSHLVLTDSGGIQEEAPTLGKPVLVMREVTERPEGIEAGCAQLVGTAEDRIVTGVIRLMDDPAAYQRMAHARNPYGDGTSCRAIADLLEQV
ncbi:MAG: UDP-N-acetylglucosamine 2-epimerase (non-hydrolyzing) [Deltaproteobacteria bacterium]|nr:UDP-N-acetylglucosamine 2-epimerase (non-hydrolyzing) [Deltaproteobacteria bacterium]